MIGEPQQSALGDWVLFDGKTKLRFPTRAAAAAKRRRLAMGTAITVLEELMLENVNKAQDLMDGLVKPARVWSANGMSELVGATPAGQTVPGSSLPVERWLMLAELFDAFSVWLKTPLPVCGLTPETIVSICDGEVAE